MKTASIRQVLDGEIAAGSDITVQGWVRTRRDSKAGFSFIHLNDGSCFANLQIVASRDLPNYEDGILRLTCSQDEKLSLLARITGLGAAVADLDVIPPSLEDIYSHFSRRDGQ